MDVRKKLIWLIAKAKYICANDYSDHTEDEYIAGTLLDNGVTVQEWIPVKERLPEENECVLIWCGECQIARIEKGISEEQRNAMKRGGLDDPCETGWTSSSGSFQLKRSDSYKACDEGWNNRVPYCWHVHGGMAKIFGQNVTHWMPLPQPPQMTRHTCGTCRYYDLASNVCFFYAEVQPYGNYYLVDADEEACSEYASKENAE